MENQETKITPQDIIDKEFRVKFRGFDRDEVDSFLEELAENLFKLTDENTTLNEKILALQQDLEAAGSVVSQGQMELPVEIENILEDLKQDIIAISADLASLKQDKPSLASLENNLKVAVTALQEATREAKTQGQPEIPADFLNSLVTFQQGAETVAAELAALKEDRQVFDSLKSSLKEIISSAREAAATMAPQQQVEIGADLNKTMADFTKESETIRTDLAALRQELGTISEIREDIKKEVQELLASHFKELETKLSSLGDRTGAAPPKKKEKLLAAEIIEEPKGKEEAVIQDYKGYDEDFTDDGALEFLSEDDILDVDKLRNVFQSVLDEDLRDSQESSEGDEVTADLLFLDDLLEDEPEPKVTFSMDEKETGNK
jgi:DivIVA domain-containing protein